jgi:hypothetical protein
VKRSPLKRKTPSALTPFVLICINVGRRCANIPPHDQRLDKGKTPMTKDILSPELLRKLVRYEPSTGMLFWLKRSPHDFTDGKHPKENICAAWNARFAGREAFSVDDGNGYKHGKIGGKHLKAHRVAWVVHYGKWPEDQIDHINGNRSDNRIENLREVSNSGNQRNKSARSDNKSGYCGVYWCKTYGKWVASARLNGRQKYIGSFRDLQDAATARAEFNKKNGFTERHGRRNRSES